LELVEIENQIEVPTIVETIVHTEEVFHSPEQNAIIRRLEEELEQSQQTITQCKSEMVTMTEHQNVFRQLQTMSTTKNETFVELNRAKEKLKKIRGQLDGALEKIKNVFSIYYDILACRAPATNYALFLLERYLLLKLKAIRAGTPSDFTTVSNFVSCFKEQEEGI
jgi:hypothetical protein